jgi:hypothetical protein
MTDTMGDDMTPRAGGAWLSEGLAVNGGTGTNFNSLAGLPAGTVVAGPGATEEWSGCGGAAKRPRCRLSQISDGLTKTILLAESAGREDVWREGTRYPANADNAAGVNCARAQGGAWRTARPSTSWANSPPAAAARWPRSTDAGCFPRARVGRRLPRMASRGRAALPLVPLERSIHGHPR